MREHKFTPIAPEVTTDEAAEIWQWCIRCGCLKLGGCIYLPGPRQKKTIQGTYQKLECPPPSLGEKWLDQAEAKVKILRSALRLYASRDYWNSKKDGPMAEDQSLIMNRKSEGWFRPGARARKALNDARKVR